PNSELAADTRRQLQRILKSSLFSKSPQASKLLSFLIDEGLSPNQENTRSKVKEYSIAVQVFGRPDTFNPVADNIVRVEVRRVRSKLQAYYEGEGALDPIEIAIPKGTYIPSLTRREISDMDLAGQVVARYKLIRRRWVNDWAATYDAKGLND